MSLIHRLVLVYVLAHASLLHAQQTFNLLPCTSLPEKIQMHGTAVVGNRIYVIGGDTNPDGWSDRVYSAEIRDGGTVGSWRPEQSLPHRRAYISNAVEVVNNRIYIVSGSEAPQANTPEKQIRLKNDVLWTTVQPDGTLSPWQLSQPIPGPKAVSVASAANDRFMYVSGGSGTAIFSDVYLAKLAADGGIRQWQAPAKLPVPLWFHGMSILDNRLYVYGGLTTKDNTSINNDVWSAAINNDGTLTPWREETPMPQGVYASAFSGFNDYLVCVAGRYTKGEPHDQIWYANVVDGKLQQWQSLKSDVKARLFHSVGLDEARGTIYIAGGQYRSGIGAKGEVLDAVQAFRIAAPRTNATAVAASAKQKFLPLAKALAQAAVEKKHVLAVFHSPEVPAAQRLWNEVIQAPGFAALARNFLVAEADVSEIGSSTSYKYSIFKVPALAVIKQDGTLVSRTMQVKTLTDVQQFLNSLPQ